MCFALRQITRQRTREFSSTSMKESGIPIVLGTSSMAPDFDLFFTRQENAPPLNSIVPALKTRRRGMLRFSIMLHKIPIDLLIWLNSAGLTITTDRHFAILCLFARGGRLSLSCREAVETQQRHR